MATRVAECNAREMYLPEVTEAELRYGVAITRVGRLRNTLESVMTRWLDLGLRERIRPFISASARAPAARPAVAPLACPRLESHRDPSLAPVPPGAAH